MLSKRNLSILLLICFSSVFLISCGSGEMETQQNGETTKQSDKATSSEAGTNDVGSQPINADDLLDQEIYNRALGNKDNSECDKIENNDLKDECKEIVDAIIIKDEAVTKLDASLCEDIELKRYKSDCTDLVNSLIKEQKEKEERIELEQSEEQERRNFEQEAMETKNPDLCDKIEDEGQLYTCKFNVIADIAVEENDPDECEAIGKEDLIKLCEENHELNLE
ncbi:hypothetical protein ACFL21_04450 [Patescibacteria group bacterium]